jgi:ribosome-binding protein aMBF1 (putative translation factor)
MAMLKKQNQAADELKTGTTGVTGAQPCVLCGADATMRISVSGKMMNVCRAHYDKHFQQEAEAYCNKHGMKTVQDMIDFCKTKAVGAKAPSKQWAHDIVRDYEAGTYRYRHHYEDACRVICKEPVPWQP